MIDFELYTHYDRRVEDAILGAIMLEHLAMSRTIGLIKPENFYWKEHQQIYSAMMEMFNANAPIDSITVCDYLANKMGVSKLMGENIHLFVTRMTNNVCSSAHLEYHCSILREQWQRREILRAKFDISHLGNTNPLDDVKSLQNRLNSILSGDSKAEWKSLDELIYELMKHQYAMAAGEFKYITTGFERLDKVNGGFTPGELIIVGARPRVGKSSLLGKMAMSQARQGFKVGIVSLEMPNIQITARLAALETEMDYMDIYRDIANDQDQHKRFYDLITREAIHLPIYISDKTKVSVPEIKAKALKLKSKHGLDVLFIDYLQLIDGKSDNKNYNREQEVSQLSRGLKVMAKEIECPVIALAQLNRNVEARKGDDRFPKLSDLRESGSLEQDADVVMFLHRDHAAGMEVNPETGESTEREADLLVRKWRNGQECHLELDFDPPKMKFSERKRGFYKPLNESTFHEGNWKRLEAQNGDNPF